MLNPLLKLIGMLTQAGVVPPAGLVATLPPPMPTPPTATIAAASALRHPSGPTSATPWLPQPRTASTAGYSGSILTRRSPASIAAHPTPALRPTGSGALDLAQATREVRASDATRAPLPDVTPLPAIPRAARLPAVLVASPLATLPGRGGDGDRAANVAAAMVRFPAEILPVAPPGARTGKVPSAARSSLVARPADDHGSARSLSAAQARTPTATPLAMSRAPAMASQSSGAATGPRTPARMAPPTIQTTSPTLTALPGREDDGRVAGVAFRLATAGRARCPVGELGLGLVLQHLTQFESADRPGMVTALHLDRGPGVIVVVPGSPAALAGIRTGDVLLAVDGRPLPPEPGTDAPFASASAHARADAVHDLLTGAAARPFAVTLLRDGGEVTVRVAALPACPSRVHLARSRQRNAFADGRHVFLTTGVLERLRSDDELAFLIAHEMAHNILGHAAVMRGGDVRKGLGRTFGRSGAIIRRTEAEADALGAELMLDAGYDAVAGAGVIRRFDGGGPDIALLSTHAGSGARIAAITAIAAARANR